MNLMRTPNCKTAQINTVINFLSHKELYVIVVNDKLNIVTH